MPRKSEDKDHLNNKVNYGLTLKERAFCDEYLKNGGNGTKAVLKEYNTDSEVTAAAIACRMLKKPQITAYLDIASGGEEGMKKLMHELWKDIDGKDRDLRKNALVILGRAKLGEKRINVDDQKKEYRGLS